MDRNQHLEMVKTIEQLAENFAFRDKTVFIMGHSEASEVLAEFLGRKKIKVTAFLDNHVQKQGRACRGIPVISPEQALIPFCPSALILIISRHYESMAAQLRGLGYESQIVKAADYDSFSEFSLSEEVFDRKAARVREGLQLLEQLKRQCPGCQFVVGPYNALGDVYLVCAYLREYCRKKAVGEDKIRWVVTGKGCGQIPPMFQFETTEVLSQKNMDRLVQAVIFLGDHDFWILHHDRPYTNVNVRISDFYPVTFMEHYPCCVMGLPKSTERDKPRRRAAQRGFPEIVKGKSVILSPYAKSTVNLPECFWEKLAWEWKAKGFTVLTNISGDETPVKGTKGISYDLNEMAEAVEYAGYFVGIRSGLCDVIREAECKKEIVYPEGKYSTTNMELREFFDMNFEPEEQN